MPHFSPIFLFARSVCPSGNPFRLFSPEPDPLCMISAACTSLHFMCHDIPPGDNYSHCQIRPSRKTGNSGRAEDSCALLLQGPKHPTQLSYSRCSRVNIWEAKEQRNGHMCLTGQASSLPATTFSCPFVPDFPRSLPPSSRQEV